MEEVAGWINKDMDYVEGTLFKIVLENLHSWSTGIIADFRVHKYF